MRVRLVIEMDAPIISHRDITDRITDAALKVLKRRKGHLVSVFHTADPMPSEQCVVGWIESGEQDAYDG